MKKAFVLLSGALALMLATAGPTMAKDKAPSKPAVASAKGAAPAGKVDSVTGPVKGSPTGKTFVIARRGGTVTVDASKAKVRQNGKFGSFDLIKGGAMVTAKGTLNGSMLNATDVEVHGKATSGKILGKK